MTETIGKMSFIALMFIAWAVAIVGWFLNIFALASAAGFGGLEVARALGVVMVPVGVLLGWFF